MCDVTESVLGIQVHGLELAFHLGHANPGLLEPPEFLCEILEVNESSPHVVSSAVRRRAERLVRTLLDEQDSHRDPLRQVIQVRVAEGGDRLRWRWVDGSPRWQPASKLPSQRLVLAKLGAFVLERALGEPNSYVKALDRPEVEGLVAHALRYFEERVWVDLFEAGDESGDVECRAERYIRRLFRRHRLLAELGAGTLRIRSRLRLRVPVSVAAIGGLWHAARHADRLVTLERETPLLLPLCLVVAEPGETPPGPSGIRDRLRGEGLSRRGWKLLANWADVLVLKCLARAGLFKRVCDAGRLARLVYFFHQAGAVDGRYRPYNAEEAIVLGLEARTRYPALAERAAKTLCLRGSPPGTQIAQELRVLEHRARVSGGTSWLKPDVSWQELVAETRGWLGARNFGLWSTPVTRFARNGLEARVLRRYEDLVREGREMRHCVATMVGQCESGDLVVFSIRGTGADRRRATAAFELDPDSGAWTLSEIKGKSDRDAAPEVQEFAEKLGARMTRATRLADRASGPGEM